MAVETPSLLLSVVPFSAPIQAVTRRNLTISDNQNATVAGIDIHFTIYTHIVLLLVVKDVSPPSHNSECTAGNFQSMNRGGVHAKISHDV